MNEEDCSVWVLTSGRQRKCMKESDEKLREKEKKTGDG